MYKLETKLNEKHNILSEEVLGTVVFVMSLLVQVDGCALLCFHIIVPLQM